MVDLEAQLALDEGQDEAALRVRDRTLYLELPGAPRAVDALLGAWLQALRDRFGSPRVGERVATAQRVVAYALTLAGLSLGWGVAEVLLRYEQGAAPVNVGYYLFVLVFGQLALLALLGLGLLLRSVWPALPLVGDIARLLRFVTGRLERRLQGSAVGERGEAQRAAYHRIRTRLGLYERVERYFLLSQTQLFAVAFNVGALASCLRLILLSDLAFAWSTSVTSLDATQIHRLCVVLGWPFAWLVPDAVPSRSLIEHTQYFRLEGRFAGASTGSRGDPALAGEWWRFLVACTVTYGLLPRLLAYAAFWAKFREAERTVPLDTPAVQRVVTRMTTPALTMRAHETAAQGAEPAREVAGLTPSASATTALVLYRDIPTDRALLRRRITEVLGLAVTRVHHAGGLDVQHDAALCQTLREDSASVTLVAEAWEAPDKSLRQLLGALREALGPRRTLRVLLIGEASANAFQTPAPEDVRVYRDRLTLLEDPYLMVECLPGTRPSHAGEEGRP